MAYKDFANDRQKGMLGDVLMFYGAEDYLMSWAVEKIIEDNVEAENRDLDVRYMDGENVTAFDIMAEAGAYSMFSPRRVVVVRNYLPMYRKAADAGMDELPDFAGEKLDSAIVVFVVESRFSGDIGAFGKKMIKACGSYEFSRLERADLKAFITKRIHAAGKVISRRGLEHMIDLTGYYNRNSVYDLSQLDRDIKKITGACSGDEITAELTEEILIGDSDRFVFNLVDALTAGDRGKSLAIAEAIIRDDDGAMAVLALLTKQFEIMYDALELSERGYSITAMAGKTGVNEFRFRRACTAAGRYSLSRIRKILTDLYNADRDIKRGDIDRDTALELIAVSACP